MQYRLVVVLIEISWLSVQSAKDKNKYESTEQNRTGHDVWWQIKRQVKLKLKQLTKNRKFQIVFSASTFCKKKMQEFLRFSYYCAGHGQKENIPNYAQQSAWCETFFLSILNVDCKLQRKTWFNLHVLLKAQASLMYSAFWCRRKMNKFFVSN